MRIPLCTTLCFCLAPFRILSLLSFSLYLLVWVYLGSSWLWPPMLLVPGYLFPSSGSGNFKLMHFQLPSHFLLLLVNFGMLQFSSVQSLSHVWLFVTPWTAECQASLFFTNSQSLLKLMSIELVMPSSHLILCHPFTFLPSISSSIRVFSKESVLCIRWPKYWSFSFCLSPSNECSGLISFRID